MSKIKLNMDQLKVQSFITSIKSQEEFKERGGDSYPGCSTLGVCCSHDNACDTIIGTDSAVPCDLGSLFPCTAEPYCTGPHCTAHCSPE